MNDTRSAYGDYIKLGNDAGGPLFSVSMAGAAPRRVTVAIGALTLLVGGLFLTGCASDRQASSPPTHTARKSDSDRTHPASAAGVTPEKVKAALTELEKLAKEALKKPGVPGLAIAVVYQDRVVYARGFGVREAGKPDLVDADTVFQLASVSKPLGSTVIAVLVSDKLVTWDDRIIDHDPGFRMHDPYVTAALTIRDMYSHRSGLPEHVGDLLKTWAMTVGRCCAVCALFQRRTIFVRIMPIPISA
jgi:Beta-lactamase class C and other penicillin binding proteins